MPPRNILKRLAASTGGGTTSALTLTHDDKFWQAVTDTEVFNAPMGAAVAAASAGAVVKESGRYIDPFNDRWIATVDADGDTAWLRELEELSLDGDEDDREAEWVVAIESNEDGVAAARPADEAPHQPQPRNILVLPSASSDEIGVYEHYWNAVYDEERDRDWNTEYQLAVEQILFDAETDSDTARRGLHTLVEAFASHVESGVTTIVTEMFSSTKEKAKEGGGVDGAVVARHPSVAGVYYLDGTVFRIAIDGKGSLGGDASAMKVFSHHAKNMQMVAHIAPRHMLSVPMALTMVFAGYRVLATSIPPVGQKAAGVKVTEGSIVAELVSGLGSDLNLKPTTIDGELKLSPSFRVFAGQDCRLYLFGLIDLMPPLAPPSLRSSYQPKITSLYWRARREALFQAANPVSSSAFIKGCSTEEEDAEALRLTHWVRCVGLQTCAAVLGLMESCTVEMERMVCAGCSKEIADELRFGVCTRGCCYVCAQCNINAYECLAVKKDSKAYAEMLNSFVKCESPPLNQRSFRLYPDVTTLFHHYGVNLRFLHAVYSLLPASAKRIMGYHLELEMVARAAKSVLNRRLRRGTTSLQDIGTISANFFMALMQPGGEVAETFWAQELGPAIQELFDVFIPFDTEALDIARVCERVSELTGVFLTEESIESFANLQKDEEGRDGGEVAGSDSEAEPSKHVPTPPRNRKPAASSLKKNPPAATSASKGKKMPPPASVTAPPPPPPVPSDIKETPKEDLQGKSFIQISAINPTMKDFSIPSFASVSATNDASEKEESRNKQWGSKTYLKERLSSMLLFWAGQMDGCKEQFMMFEAAHPRYLEKVKQSQ